jgi:hypothetical protein
LELNFNLILVLILICASCGIKGLPNVPKDSRTPTVLDNYPDIKIKEDLKETDKKF